MSDSVDRVFVHALNTVKKIPRTGTAKPPASARLRLYGLYKQSMEGDVEGVMQRPTGEDERTYAEREKWDAWNEQKGMSKTDAKRQYITTLIDTMHKYASTSLDAKELASELEFVWGQIKSNHSSSSSSPHHKPSSQTPFQPTAPLRILSPMSDEDLAAEESDLFDDAKEHVLVDPLVASTTPSQADNPLPTTDALPHKWRQRVEQSLIKMTAEIAALREQMETRRGFEWRRRRNIGAWLAWVSWIALKHVTVDSIVAALLLLWMRRRRDPRLEKALRQIWLVFKEGWGRR
ncbi:MAG: hypothetical protein M1829_004079 [Trizodia sp. TS-e1964]|nr:MAG: hypothetical protein M1829_004079 [Trizodia sp. TS-e1964]